MCLVKSTESNALSIMRKTNPGQQTFPALKLPLLTFIVARHPKIGSNRVVDPISIRTPCCVPDCKVPTALRLSSRQRHRPQYSQGRARVGRCLQQQFRLRDREVRQPHKIERNRHPLRLASQGGDLHHLEPRRIKFPEVDSRPIREHWRCKISNRSSKKFCGSIVRELPHS